MKLKKGDNVILIAGKDKGKTGKIIKSLPKENKVIVDGLNMLKKHQRPRKMGEKGSIVNVSMPIHVSNVMLVDPKKNKRTRIGNSFVSGKKVRITKKSNTQV